MWTTRILEKIHTICFNLWRSSYWSAAKPVATMQNVEQNVDHHFRDINDSVYELRPGTNPQIDVVFFHGLPLNKGDESETYWKVWTKRDTNECWPTTMLPDYLSRKKDGDSVGYDPRVLAVSYNNKLELPANRGTEGTDIYVVIENLTKDLILDAGAGQIRPVILVGHDLGGILIKQLILYVVDVVATEGDDGKKGKLNNFLENLRSVFFYSTPHAGSPAIERVAKNIPKTTQNQMLQCMKVLGKDMSRVNNEFTQYHNKTLRFETFALTASDNTTRGDFHGECVCPEGSARNDTDNYYTVMGADHYEVCQPAKVSNNSLKNLADNIVDVVDKFRKQQEEIRYNELQNYKKNKFSGDHEQPPGETSTAMRLPEEA